MECYNPSKAPNSAQWLTLEENERISVVIQKRRRQAAELPDEALHATIHVVVENQLALADDRVQKTLQRLMRQGLDRHDAIHAVGSILAAHLYALTADRNSNPGSHDAYYTRLKKLTAKRWLKAEY